MESAEQGKPSLRPERDEAPRTPSPPTQPPLPPPTVVSRTRAGSIWVSLAAGGAFLIVLLIFVVQNTTSVRLGFLGWHFTLPIGVAILVAAVVGLLVMAVAGGIRIIQLRQAFNKLARSRKSGARLQKWSANTP